MYQCATRIDLNLPKLLLIVNLVPRALHLFKMAAVFKTGQDQGVYGPFLLS